MLISHRYKFIYTKTAKTAGTSVESYFERFCMADNEWQFSHAREEYESEHGIIGYRGMNAAGKKWYNHMPAVEIRNKVGANVWNSYFKFCVVRNPFDKLVSGFYFNNKNLNTDVVPDSERIKAFREWIRSGGAVLDRDKYLIEGKVCVDDFIRYEDLHNGMKKICDQLGVTFDPALLPKLKSGIRSNSIAVRDYYDDDTIAMVNEAYALELDLFRYQLE